MGERICRLVSMCPGQKGRIAGMHVGENIGRRLKDMGFVQGGAIECVYRSPFGDPTAYFVKGTLIAIRNEDAENIDVDIEGGVKTDVLGEGKKWV